MSYTEQIAGGHIIERCSECHAEIADDAYHLAGCSSGRAAPVEVEAITEETPISEPDTPKAPVRTKPELPEASEPPVTKRKR